MDEEVTIFYHSLHEHVHQFMILGDERKRGRCKLDGCSVEEGKPRVGYGGEDANKTSQELFIAIDIFGTVEEQTWTGYDD